MTFAHEVGHNLAADHDEDAGCPPNYIMSSSGSNLKDPQFSSCSIHEMSKELSKKLRNPRSTCLTEIAEENKEDFSLCGNGEVEGDEECDCGLSYLTCGDPCCYAAHIDPYELSVNKSATPCRRSSSHNCLHPFDSVWQYGFVAPWIFIAVMVVVLSAALIWDWRNDKRCYTHVTKPSEMIRSETAEQMTRRLQRQRSEGKQVMHD
jgi:hypothetical protein